MRRKKSAKVLIVGNGRQISKIVAERKTFFGHKPIRVTNREEALEIVSKHPPIDFLVTDIMMPEMPGENFVEQFTKLYPKANVIYMIL